MYYQNEPDETLLMLTLAGEQRAYEVLVTRYQKLTVASAMAVTKSHFMAEDAAQDAFVTAWMKLNTLQEPKKYGSWVCRIARNCALNMISRYRSFLPLDVVENLDISDDGAQNPAEIYALSEERDELNKSLEALPEKVRQIIHLHYFENLSIAEIADRMRISGGTVKWQLHEGRKRIRKELCAMNEKYSDTLVERVMKKVEELKLWQFKNSKSGFEKVYKEVLREVEELPECRKKQHALADVLMRGWWWIPGEKKDVLFARIVDAAMEGKNEEVMTFIVTREDSNVYGDDAKIEFIRDKQIPRLEKAGFVMTLAREWFWLGYYLCDAGKKDEGLAAYNKVKEILRPGETYRALVPYALRLKEQLETRYKDATLERYSVSAKVEEYRTVGDKPKYWTDAGFNKGYLGSFDWRSNYIFRNASSCDAGFFEDISLGETYVGTDGTKLSYISDNESIDTPAGRFDDCQLWETRRLTDTEKIVCRTYYKDGVGIVRQDHTTDGVTTTHVLSSYEIKGGNGLLPLFEGNTWKYSSACSPDAISSELEIAVSFVGDDRILVSYWSSVERLGYDEDSWIEMVQKIANEYVVTEKDGREYARDVHPAIERAEQLAVTPMEKAYTKAAASTARRILATDPTFNPQYTATGHWNFFNRNYIRKKADSLYMTDYNSRWSFEWKNMDGYAAQQPLLYNDVLGILQDAANCIWSDEWRIGASPIIEYTRYAKDIKTNITCEDGGTVTTKAGIFENCFKLCLDIGGMDAGWSYRGGKKVYYFADGVGIVRTECEYCEGARTAVYELTAYEGVGEGYMPVEDGMMRRYDAIGLTDGYVGSAEYTYVADDDGDIVVFADRVGIREVPPPITEYRFIQSEVKEGDLWEQGKHDESRLCHDVNNFELLCHFLGRNTRYWGMPDRAVAWNKYRLRIIEGFGDGAVPDAWLGLYASTTFRTACALFGCGKTDEGYEWLEKAFEVYPKWDSILAGTEMDVGDPLIYGGVKVVKGKSIIKLPNGTTELISDPTVFKGDSNLMHYGMTAPYGWEWFDSVRKEERFKEYIERAKKLAGIK